MKKSILVALVFLEVLFIPANLSEFKDNKIINGHEVRPMFKYPYQAYFLAGPHKCGATVIGRRHAITAAHCIKGEAPTRRTYIIVGEHRVTINDAFGRNAESIFGSNIIRVSKFIRFTQDRRADIGMLELERDIQYSSRVAPACIPARGAGDFAGRDAVITGWGGTVGYSAGQYVKQRGSDVLLETTVQVLSPNHKLCRKTFANKPNKLCAYRQGHDTCQGDSGGPMTVKQNGKFLLIGVTSSGKGCGDKDQAGIYMRVWSAAAATSSIAMGLGDV